MIYRELIIYNQRYVCTFTEMHLYYYTSFVHIGLYIACSAMSDGDMRENCTRVERPSARQPTYESGQLTLSGTHMDPDRDWLVCTRILALSLSFFRVRTTLLATVMESDDARGIISYPTNATRWFHVCIFSHIEISLACDKKKRANIQQ